MGGRTIKCIWHCFLGDKGWDRYLSPIQALAFGSACIGDAYRSEPLSPKKQCHMHSLSRLVVKGLMLLILLDLILLDRSITLYTHVAAGIHGHTCRPLRYERVYLPLCKVADTQSGRYTLSNPRARHVLSLNMSHLLLLWQIYNHNVNKYPVWLGRLTWFLLKFF